MRLIHVALIFLLVFNYIIPIQGVFTPAVACQWSAIAQHSIRLEGSITRNECERLSSFIHPGLKTLTVRSFGGDALGTLNLADKVKNLELTIVVDGYCAGACADYLFVAAQKKVVPPGSWVGFSGGITSPEAQSISADYPSGGDHVICEAARLKKKFSRLIFSKQLQLYNTLGISPQLLEYARKAIRSGLFPYGHNVYWAPPPACLEALGVKGLDMWSPSSEEELLKLGRNTNHNLLLFFKLRSLPPPPCH